jgi:Oxidoreductase molybdopterin binding domain
MVLAIASLLLLQSPPAPSESLPFDVDALKKQERVELRVKEGDKEVTYRGVPLSVVLGAKSPNPKSMQALRSLSDAVLLVHATDGYQAAVSAAAVAMDKSGQRYLLALERNGQLLDETHGPIELIIPGDSEHVRWVRMVAGVDLVRLRGVKASSRAASTPRRDR